MFAFIWILEAVGHNLSFILSTPVKALQCIMPRHSKLQIQVLCLYKNFLKAAANKPGVKSQVQFEFRKWAQLQETDVLRIEHLLRRGERQLKMLQTGAVDRAGTFSPEDNQKIGKSTNETNVT